MNEPETIDLTTIEIDEIEFTNIPSTLVADSVREWESMQELLTQDTYEQDLAWSTLANQVVGHEVDC